MKQKISLFVLAVGLFIMMIKTPVPVFSNQGTTDEFSRPKAKQVDFFLKRIAKQQRHKVFLRKISFSQEQLNSYLNLVYIKKNTPEVKYVKLHLHKKKLCHRDHKDQIAREKVRKSPFISKGYRSGGQRQDGMR